MVSQRSIIIPEKESWKNSLRLFLSIRADELHVIVGKYFSFWIGVRGVDEVTFSKNALRCYRGI